VRGDLVLGGGERLLCGGAGGAEQVLPLTRLRQRLEQRVLTERAGERRIDALLLVFSSIIIMRFA